MSTTQLATASTIVAEIALALYPILIKSVNVSLPIQLLARLGTFSGLGLALSDQIDRKLSWGGVSQATQSILFGLMNLVHISASYISYNHLPAGSALALFYTYPFFNILAGILFLGESFNPAQLPLLIMTFTGVLLIAKYTKDGSEKTAEKNTVTENQQMSENQQSKRSIWLGITAALISALTESLIFLVAKTNETQSPILSILKLYPAAFTALLGWISATKTPITASTGNWSTLLIFNVLIGFLGYGIRFWSIPRLTTAGFSILSFIGVAAGYLWGLLYAEEVPSMGALVGAVLITGAVSLLGKN